MKKTIIEPYLFFGGRCEEALKFYQKAMGAKVTMLMRYTECPEPPPPGRLPKGFEKKVMHAAFTVGQSLIMCSDGCEKGQKYDGFSLSLTFSSAPAAKRAYTALGKGGKVIMPLGKTFWSPCFGMVTDKFGIHWMVTTGQG